MDANVIPFNPAHPLPRHRALTEAETRRAARCYDRLSDADRSAYLAGIRDEDQMRIGVELGVYRMEQRERSAVVIKILDRDERMLYRGLQKVRSQPFTMGQFLAKREHYAQFWRDIDTALTEVRKPKAEPPKRTQPNRTPPNRTPTKKARASPKAPTKAKRQAGERLPSQERN